MAGVFLLVLEFEFYPVQQFLHRLRRDPHYPGRLRERFSGEDMPRGFAGMRRNAKNPAG